MHAPCCCTVAPAGAKPNTPPFPLPFPFPSSSKWKELVANFHHLLLFSLWTHLSFSLSPAPFFPLTLSLPPFVFPPHSFFSVRLSTFSSPVSRIRIFCRKVKSSSVRFGFHVDFICQSFPHQTEWCIAACVTVSFSIMGCSEWAGWSLYANNYTGGDDDTFLHDVVRDGCIGGSAAQALI